MALENKSKSVEVISGGWGSPSHPLVYTSIVNSFNEPNTRQASLTWGYPVACVREREEKYWQSQQHDSGFFFPFVHMMNKNPPLENPL